MKQIEEARIEEEKTSDLGKSISSELRRTESTSKPRSFAAEEQELQDRQADLVDLVEDKPGDNEYGEDK